MVKALFGEEETQPVGETARIPRSVSFKEMEEAFGDFGNEKVPEYETQNKQPIIIKSNQKEIQDYIDKKFDDLRKEFRSSLIGISQDVRGMNSKLSTYTNAVLARERPYKEVISEYNGRVMEKLRNIKGIVNADVEGDSLPFFDDKWAKARDENDNVVERETARVIIPKYWDLNAEHLHLESIMKDIILYQRSVIEKQGGDSVRASRDIAKTFEDELGGGE